MNVHRDVHVRTVYVPLISVVNIKVAISWMD